MNCGGSATRTPQPSDTIDRIGKCLEACNPIAWHPRARYRLTHEVAHSNAPTTRIGWRPAFFDRWHSDNLGPTVTLSATDTLLFSPPSYARRRDRPLPSVNMILRRSLLAFCTLLMAAVGPVHAEPPTLTLMPLGDSMTAGGGTCCNHNPPPGSYRAPMYALLTSAGYKVKYVGDQTINPGNLPSGNEHHEGIGGINIADLHTYLKSKGILTTYRPNVITLLIGYNSIYGAHGISPSAAFSELRSLCDYILMTLPSVKIIVGTLPPSSGDPGTGSETEGGQFNLSILGHGLTGLNPNISDANLNTSMTLYGIGPDGLHPNQPGSDIMANVFGHAIMNVFPNAVGRGVPN